MSQVIWAAERILGILSPEKTRILVSAARFLEQLKSECHFYNGTQRVRYLLRDIYNQEEVVRFDSDVGEYRAVTELGRPDAKYFNKQKEILEQRRSSVNRFCRHNYEISQSFIVSRRGKAGQDGWVWNHHEGRTVGEQHGWDAQGMLSLAASGQGLLGS